MPEIEETINESPTQAQCGHALCKCTVPARMRYCSEHCEQQAALGGSRLEGSHCGCTHGVCDETAG